jgi:tetratricopeptide (TPR) repeat protein
VQLDSDDATILYELDRLSERGRVAPEDRLTRLEAHRQTILERDDATQQLVALYVELGRYDQALDLLAHRHFHLWEGGGDIHDVYVNAHLLRGRARFKNRQYRQTLEDYQAALEYPENLEVGRPREVPREAEIYYLIGSAYDALGVQTQAQKAYEESAAIKLEGSELRYFQVLALRRLGRETEASEMVKNLLKMGTEELASASDAASSAKLEGTRSVSARLAHAHYLLGLASLGQGQRQRAKEEFQRVLDQDMNHLGARTQLAEL